MRLQSDLVKGTADVVSHDNKTAVVLDWKTGHGKQSHKHQLYGYAHALRAERGMPESGVITVFPVYLRDGEIDATHLDSGALDLWAEQLQEKVAQVGKLWGPGEGCKYCPRRLGCEARQVWLGGCGAIVKGSAKTLQAGDLAALWPRVKEVEKACADYKAALRSVIETHGEQDMGEGLVAYLQERKEATVDPAAARQVLLDSGWSKKMFQDALKMSKTSITKIIEQKSEKGQAAKNKREILQRLDAAGALHYKTTKRLATKRGEK